MHTALLFSRSFRYPFAIAILIDFRFAEVHFLPPFLHGIHTLVSLSTRRLSMLILLAPPLSPLAVAAHDRVPCRSYCRSRLTVSVCGMENLQRPDARSAHRLLCLRHIL